MSAAFPAMRKFEISPRSARVIMQVRFAPDLHRQVTEAAKARRMSTNAFLEIAIREAMKALAPTPEQTAAE